MLSEVMVYAPISGLVFLRQITRFPSPIQGLHRDPITNRFLAQNIMCFSQIFYSLSQGFKGRILKTGNIRFSETLSWHNFTIINQQIYIRYWAVYYNQLRAWTHDILSSHTYKKDFPGVVPLPFLKERWYFMLLG